MTRLNIDKLRAAGLQTDPFEYVIVPGFLSPDCVSEIVGTYPDIVKGGSFPPDTVTLRPPLTEVLDELDGPQFEQAIEEKFDVSLAGRPKMYSLRGYCRGTDGKIHTDSKDKIITVLLYLNDTWQSDGGKLRLLRNGDDLEDFAAEVPPDNGTVLVFRRSEKSFHGHGSFEGVRRSVQMNWMVSDNKRAFHKLRHNISAGFKKLAAG